MHFDPTISLGNILATVTFLIGALLAWRDLSWRVKNLEVWRKDHEHATIKAHENIEYLKRLAGKMEEIIRGQNRRLEILEERGMYYRQKGPQ